MSESNNTMPDDNASQLAPDECDIFNILIATDNHLGFDEGDPVREQDTFDTFEEILQIAVEHEVDFILLGGDLFHHAKPSPYCIHKCTELLRRYCLGDKPVEIEFLSDPSHNFRNLYNPTVNYEDPNLNVSIPVFSIHGNHDDPTGHRQISAMDLMATSGLINYFGRNTCYEEIEIEPILLKKGQTKLALYGLSHIKDERLARLFMDQKVRMLAPPDQKNWFHLLVWHQNRAVRGTKNFIPDNDLPTFLNLVIWGHEHDCRIEAERKTNDVLISQPGSSVATSLAAGEASPKKVGILKIHKDLFKIIPIELKTVRPFIYADMLLQSVDEMEDEIGNKSPNELVLDLVTQKVDSMIQEAKELGRTDKVSEKPLVRLNVKYRDERQAFNAIRFGQAYAGRVANPDDMVKCQAIREPVRRNRNGDGLNFDQQAMLADRVEDIVSKHFSENDTLECFTVQALNEAVKKYIDSNDTEAPSLVSDLLIKKAVQYLEEHMPELDDIQQYIANFKNETERDTLNNINEALNDANRKTKCKTSNDGNGVAQDSDDDVSIIDDDVKDNDIGQSQTRKTVWGPEPVTPPKRGPGSRGGKGSRGGRGSRAKGRAK